MIENFGNGKYLVYTNADGDKIIFIGGGPVLKVEIIRANEFPEDSDEWTNKKIEDYLKIKEYKK